MISGKIAKKTKQKLEPVTKMSCPKVTAERFEKGRKFLKSLPLLLMCVPEVKCAVLKWHLQLQLRNPFQKQQDYSELLAKREFDLILAG